MSRYTRSSKNGQILAVSPGRFPSPRRAFGPINEHPMKPKALASIVAIAALIGSSMIPSASSQEPKPTTQAPKEARPPEPPPPPNEPLAPGDQNPGDFVFTTDEAIKVFENRVKKNPKDFISLRYLGELFEKKAHESGNHAEFEKAEVALRKSLALLPEYPRAQASLAAVLCARHKFAEGLAISEMLLKANPKDIDALSTFGDALLELGRYDEAEAAIKTLFELAPYPEVMARQARIAELKGDSASARRLMSEAAARIRKLKAPKADAWYLCRLGDIALDAGDLEEAARSYGSVPEGTDPFHDATFGLCRVRAAKGQFDEAIALGAKAVAISPDPHMLAALGDLYLKVGKPEKAEPLFEKLLALTKDKSEYLRVRALFLADHDRDLPEALKFAREDLAQRKDVHAYDTLAWTLYKNGQFDEAANAIADALKPGARDAIIEYHAGMIYLKRGNRDQARKFLKSALARNPEFSPIHATEARKALAELGG